MEERSTEERLKEALKQAWSMPDRMPRYGLEYLGSVEKWYGICDVYRDEDGKFWYDSRKKE